MTPITPHKGGRTAPLSARLTPAEVAAINAARGQESVSDWVARCAALPTAQGQRVRVTLGKIAGDEITTAEGQVTSADGKLSVITNTGQRIEIELMPDTIAPPPVATHYVVSGGLIFACVSEAQAKTTAAMDNNARVFDREEDARAWAKNATEELAPNNELIKRVAAIFKDDSDKDQQHKRRSS
jgi:hypothetical protein